MRIEVEIIANTSCYRGPNQGYFLLSRTPTIFQKDKVVT